MELLPFCLDFFFLHTLEFTMKLLTTVIWAYIFDHSHLVQQYAMNRSKIDQSMNTAYDVHWYLYSWNRITSSKRDWYGERIQRIAVNASLYEKRIVCSMGT